MRRDGPSPWKLPVLSGLLAVVAYYGTWFAPILFMLTPMLAWLDADARVSPPSAKRRYRVGLIFGLAMYGVGQYWLYATLEFTWLGALMWLGLTLLFTLTTAIALTIAGWMRRVTGWTWGIVLPVTWLPFEYARAWGDLRMTADQVSNSLAKFPFLSQFADVVGPYGIGAAILVTNGLLYDIVRRRGAGRTRLAAAWIAMVVAIVAYDAWAWQRWAPDPDAPKVKVAVIQPDIPYEIKGDDAAADQVWPVLERLSRKAAEAGAELIVWSESARPTPLYHFPEHPSTYRMPDVEFLAASLDVPFLVGSEYGIVRSRESIDWYNAAFAVHADGTLDPTWAAKVYLVPFVERIPFRGALGWFLEGLEGDLHWLAGVFLPGPRATVLPIGDVRAGVMVCFEEFYPELGRELHDAGANLMVVVTNDVWWGRTRFQGYIADILRLRAIETRTSYARAANNGISGFVDPRGTYLERTGLFEEVIAVAEVPLTDVRTVYVRAGNVTAWAAIVALFVLCGVARRRSAGGRRVDVPAPGAPAAR